MLEFFQKLFDPSGFIPRRFCGEWTSAMIGLHVASDLLIWLAFIAIPIMLMTFACCRRDLPFPWMFWLFSAFILSCGFTHLLEALMFYYPVYRVAGLLKLVTAVVSVATVAVLVPLVPRALALASPDDLKQEIEQKNRLEEQLRLAVDELERSNRELQDFASVASHDLQEPLRKIQTFGDRLHDKCGSELSDSGRDYLQRMQNAAGRMRTLIEDLLTFSRVTTKAQPFAPIDLNEVAQAVVSDLEGTLHETGGRIEIESLLTLDADPVQMRQLFQNLMVNALKFHRPEAPPVVRVSARLVSEEPAPGFPSGTDGPSEPTQPHWCEISVEDNGIGFEEKYLDRIFNLFQRLHGRGDYQGTGMGLAICRKIVERHSGAITARSTPGQGSTFLIQLPIEQPRVASAEETLKELRPEVQAEETMT